MGNILNEDEDKIREFKTILEKLENKSLASLTDKEKDLIKESVAQKITLFENYFGGCPQRPRYHHRRWY